MQVFKIRQDGFKEIKKQTLIRMVPVMLVTATAGIIISSINSKGDELPVYFLPIIIVLIASALSVGIYLGLNRQKSLFESYTLTITSNLITREQLNTPTVSVYFNDIKEIVKHKNGSFTIKGREAVDLIAIPTQISDYQQLEIALQQIHPISVKESRPFLERYQNLTGLLTVGLMVCVYTLNNKLIVGLAGSALVVLMTWSFVKIRKSKNVDNKTKQSLWWVLLVLASVIGIMLFKLTGIVNMQNP